MKELPGCDLAVHYALGKAGSGPTLKYSKQHQESLWISL